MRWVNISTDLVNDRELELFRIFTGDPDAPGNLDKERAQISLEWQATDVSGLSFTAYDRTGVLDTHKWKFNGDGTTVFPTLTVPISDNATPNGDGQTLKFGDSTQQAIIYGPSATADNPNAERVIIQGAPGLAGTSGEGGDVYLWAGPGGNTNGDGGDIKIRAGRGNSTGSGGYLYFQTGSTDTGYAGSIRLETGSSSTYGQGGPITLEAKSGGRILLRTYNSEGNSRDLILANSGNLTLPGNITFPDNTVQTTAYTGSNVQGEYIYEFDGVNTELTITNVNFNLLFCTVANAYAGSATHTVTLPAGTPGQRLVVINSTTLCTLVVSGAGEGDSSVTVNSGPAEYIYTTNEGWFAMYGTV
jgi:hypothetical protein